MQPAPTNAQIKDPIKDPTKAPTIALIACEESGDSLGQELMLKLRDKLPHAKFIGIGGQKMQAAGLRSWVEMEQLSVIGLTEALLKLTKILRISRRVKQLLAKNKPDLFIGIDAPGFNLHMAGYMRKMGCPTVQYVSPTFWAWGEKRINKVRRVINLVLCLYPMEKQRYDREKIPSVFVGHPIADQIAPDNSKSSKSAARKKLGVSKEDTPVIALLPGSRSAEITKLTHIFIATANTYLRQKRDTRFILVAVNSKWAEYIKKSLPKDEQVRRHFRVVIGQSRTAMTAADCVLLASGTATLECMFIKRPMVVAYKVSFITFFLAKNFLARIPYIAQPNILLGRMAVEEYLQQKANPANLSRALARILAKPFELKEEYNRIHRLMRRNASQKAADAVCELLNF